MSDNKIVATLKQEFKVEFLSVSEKYPNDDGCIRRMGEVGVDRSMQISSVDRMCERVAKAFGGKFNKDFRLNGNTVTFVIAYDEYVAPPAPWKVLREDPL